MGFRLGELGGIFTTSMPVPPRRGLPELLRDPGIGRTAGHIEAHDFTRAVVHDREREDGAKERVVELKEVACPNLAGISLLGGEAIPGHGLGVILGNALAVVVHQREVELGSGKSLLGQRQKLPVRGSVVASLFDPGVVAFRVGEGQL